MASENPLPDSALPVKVDVPDLSAPPTLAEPASGPAAEMSGALAAAPSEDKPETEGQLVASSYYGNTLTRPSSKIRCQRCDRISASASRRRRASSTSCG